MIIGTSYDDTLEDFISVTIIATGFEAGPRENKIIVGKVDSAPINHKSNLYDEIVEDVLPPTIQPVNPNLIAPMAETKLPVPPVEIRFNLDEIINEIKPEETIDPMEMNIRIEEDIYETEYSESFFEPIAEDKSSEMTVKNISNESYVKHVSDANLEDQDRKIESKVNRIKTLMELNVSIKSPQGLRDMEKEPAYKRKMKRLNEVPLSSASQVSRLSLFDDETGRPEIKSNNTFLHDNVD
jgi:cell division protein FtsZ